MELKALTYTSLASLDLTARDLEDIHRTAVELNALDGITGILVFNGTRFLQVIEGSEKAIDELMERLRRDRRMAAVEVRDERRIEAPSFPDWSMELVRVSASYFEARDTVGDRIPPGVDAGVRDYLLRMTEGISGTVTY
jgi:hypothetical protein